MKTIAIDFDGVIHKYSKGWSDGSIYDEPIDGAFEAIKQFMDKGCAVYIFSTRKPRQIQKWLNKEGRLWFHDAFAGPAPFDSGYGDDRAYLYDFKSEVIPRHTKFWNKSYVLGVTNRKLPAELYIDDRGLRFTDWPKCLADVSDLANSSPGTTTAPIESAPPTSTETTNRTPKKNLHVVETAIRTPAQEGTGMLAHELAEYKVSDLPTPNPDTTLRSSEAQETAILEARIDENEKYIAGLKKHFGEGKDTALKGVIGEFENRIKYLQAQLPKERTS